MLQSSAQASRAFAYNGGFQDHLSTSEVARNVILKNEAFCFSVYLKIFTIRYYKTEKRERKTNQQTMIAVLLCILLHNPHNVTLGHVMFPEIIVGLTNQSASSRQFRQAEGREGFACILSFFFLPWSWKGRRYGRLIILSFGDLPTKEADSCFFCISSDSLMVLTPRFSPTWMIQCLYSIHIPNYFIYTVNCHGIYAILNSVHEYRYIICSSFVLNFLTDFSNFK